jgi:putative ATP-binding cassette transporter
MIALVLSSFARPTPEALTGYMFAVMYMMTPLWGILTAWPAIARGQVALAKIQELGVSIDAEATPAPEPAPIRRDAPVIAMDGVTFTYGAKDDKAETGAEHAFSLGPVNFKLAAGELVFVVGGNGSGKSTFVKVLMGLYAPSHGQMAIGGTTVTEQTREWYREHFSAVFPDCFVFERLLGLSAPDLEAKTRSYLELLQIQHKVTPISGPRGLSFSTVDLSTGQRKRLALVTAYLEDRPFYVFDEWAADQDPEYKRIFYSTLLPDLRSRGKAVVVITHDDRYFHMGDRVVKLEEGKIVSDHAPDHNVSMELPLESPVKPLNSGSVALGA